MSLVKYKQKRDFSHTPEPVGKKGTRKKKLYFVIQKHDASRLHYDFRLEMEGVLKSWAVPKGPSLNPADKRLAIMVEDHPLDYGKFTGIIPEGNYGAGVVEIWDSGYYLPAEKTDKTSEEELLLKELKKGNIKFYLHGKNVQGEFALVRFHGSDKENEWLLIKKDDEFAVHKNYDSNKVKPVKPFSKRAKK